MIADDPLRKTVNRAPKLEEILDSVMILETVHPPDRGDRIGFLFGKNTRPERFEIGEKFLAFFLLKLRFVFRRHLLEVDDIDQLL